MMKKGTAEEVREIIQELRNFVDSTLLGAACGEEKNDLLIYDHEPI